MCISGLIVISGHAKAGSHPVEDLIETSERDADTFDHYHLMF